ncbi:MAG: hypothetical protein A2Y23_02295 [Clostridiales bacterium GWB2_37_7]|nr:MAG: hypothetical protein A2Y23_02295 [Clostridiales bacterium GWB2_37_7]
MKSLKELSFRCFILFVMLSLAFVAYDMSRPALQSENEMTAQDVVHYIVQPFQTQINADSKKASSLLNKDYNLLLNILLPIIVYIASIGGFMYLLIEDIKMLKTFSSQNKLARNLWCLWIIFLIGLILIPIFFGLQLLMKGIILAIITTAIFLILIGILYKFSYRTSK